ncbi:MAG: hypothetical protein HC769_00445 [Cyanobacteria bacterium CRU_2_1]|nr:hypothetical protein [Cyanobacteria bacterium RU_5_0]NJR57441.1 hypothetical protein [Cyanobacteria bacterium CRU_2_1]
MDRKRSRLSLSFSRNYAIQWGVNLQSVEPGVATRRYTDFLLATAWSQEVGITTAAMLPCMKLYAFLGQKLAQAGIPDHHYGDWIRTYGSDEFKPLVVQLMQLANQYALLTPEVGSTYRYAMQCELDFFQAAWDIGVS